MLLDISAKSEKLRVKNIVEKQVLAIQHKNGIRSSIRNLYYFGYCFRYLTIFLRRIFDIFSFYGFYRNKHFFHYYLKYQLSSRVPIFRSITIKRKRNNS